MKTICFWDNCLCERGTTVALFDYAYYNQTILHNKSMIMYHKHNDHNKDNVIQKFRHHFDHVVPVEHFDQVDPILEEHQVDLFYIIKGGHYEHQVSKKVKNAVHCVFACNQPHGDVYAAISPYITDWNPRIPVVPHMINLPHHDRHLRDMLKIPLDAVVFGRYGGYGQFDIRYVHGIVFQVAQENPSIYFLFANTQPFCPPLPNIRHLPSIVDLEKKVEFINTCDAMLWARSDGETFGLSIGEFSSRNKPVLCTRSSAHNAHLHFLGNKGIQYNPQNLKKILTSFNRDEAASQDWNAFREFAPDKVMDIFKQVFLEDS